MAEAAANPTVVIRAATAADAGAIVRLVRDLAVFEREPLSSVKITEADVRRDLFGPRPRCEVLLADLAGKPVGFALYFHNYSTWEGRSGLYVEDLFVDAGAQKLGIGRLLMAEIAAIAEARDCRRIDLSVLHWNPARRFYDRLGFAEMTDWRPYRLAAAGIRRLAQAARSRRA